MSTTHLTGRLAFLGSLVSATLLVTLLMTFQLDQSQAGPSQPCIAGDVNADGGVDIGDPIYMLQYLFQGGSSPVACAVQDCTLCDLDYVNEGQLDSVDSAMILDGSITAADLAFVPATQTDVIQASAAGSGGVLGCISLYANMLKSSPGGNTFLVPPIADAFIVDAFTQPLLVDRALTSAVVDIQQHLVFACTPYDLFLDGTLDPGLWSIVTSSATPGSSASITEANGILYVQATSPSDNGQSAQLIVDSTLNFKSLNEDVEIILVASVGSDDIGSADIGITDGVSTVPLLSAGGSNCNSNSQAAGATIRVRFDRLAELAYVDGGTSAGTIDLGVFTSWRIRLRASSTGVDPCSGSGGLTLSGFGYVVDGGVGGSAEYVTQEIQFEAAKSIALLTWSFDGDPSGAAGYVSGNNGADFFALQRNESTLLPMSSSTWRLKLSADIPTVVNSQVLSIPSFTFVGSYFD